VKEIRIYPIDVPKCIIEAKRTAAQMAPPELARRILTLMRELVRTVPWTDIRIEGNVGVIRPLTPD
jgi:hypothetical protein